MRHRRTEYPKVTDITLSDLRKKIEEKRKELNDLERALKSLELLVQEDNIPAPESRPKQSILHETGRINLDEIKLPQKAKQPRSTLVDEIKLLIPRFENQEFTVNHVHQLMLTTERGDKAKHLRNRIALSFKTLADEGFIVRTFKGKGSEPHRYKSANSADLLNSVKLGSADTDPVSSTVSSKAH